MTDVGKRPAFESPVKLARSEGGRDPRMPRPAAVVVGTMLIVLRVVAGALWLWELTEEARGVLPEVLADEGVADADLAVWIEPFVGFTVVVGGVVLALELVLGLLVFLGANWARVVVLLFGTISISGTFAAWWAGDQEIHLDFTLLTLALDILVMLALSSRPARAWARRSGPADDSPRAA